eukprot:7367180-Lingulodinium_polyedra.AAC.1
MTRHSALSRSTSRVERRGTVTSSPAGRARLATSTRRCSRQCWHRVRCQQAVASSSSTCLGGGVQCGPSA